MGKKGFNVELGGWYVQIEVLDVSKRPHWEIRCGITRSREGKQEYRGHRFHVNPELARKLRLDRLSEVKVWELLAAAAKKVILRQHQEIFAEPAGGLDSLRPLDERDFVL